MKPTIGRIVHYVSRTGNYVLPAIVNCTQGSLNRSGVEAGHLPNLSSDKHVHLTVFSPGRPGMRITGAELEGVVGAFLAKSEHPVSENVAGCYQEWDIEYRNPGLDSDELSTPLAELAGTWHWPDPAGVCVGHS